MQRVTLAENPFDEKTWVTEVVPSFNDFMRSHFVDKFPDNARIYNGQVAVVNDVTPSDEASIARLDEYEDLVVILWPGDPITQIILAVIAIAAIAAATFLLAPPATPANRRVPAGSQNNALSDRQNQARPVARIADIYGKVRSTPDLLTVPYKIFVNNVEVEVTYFCVGRGRYLLEDIKDGDTLVSEIAGTSLAVYDPFTSPNSGSPVLQIGTAITDAFLSVQQVSGVNGQALPPPNIGTYTWTSNIVFGAPPGSGSDYDYFRQSSNPVDMRDLVEPGDNITISGFAPGGLDLNGTFFVAGTPSMAVTGDSGAGVNKSFLKLWQPQFINANWGTLIFNTASTTATLTNNTKAVAQWIGPFTIDMPDLTTIIANFVALSGLYVVSAAGIQDSLDVVVELEATPIDAFGVPTAAPQLFQATLPGSAVTRDQIGLTLYCTPTVPGRQSVRVHRITTHDYTYNGQIIEDVKVRDVYGAAPVTASDFGNVTTIFARSLGTTAALSVKQRKLNMFATRKLQLRISGTTFDSAWTATQSADEILTAIAMDPYIGNRPVAELDLDTIYSTIATVKSYFGTPEAGQLNVTFDSIDISPEETINTLADAVFCVPYRRGNVLTLAFEEQTSQSTLLFNHRNKIPKSEKRTVAFGNQNDFDGVWLDYVSAVDGAKVTIYLPADRSSLNPKKVTTVGVTSMLQAYFLANRIWNKIRFQNILVEFDATQEATMCVRGQRILVADNTRKGTQDGEIIAQNVLALTLSQAVDLTGDTFSMFIQHYDGTIESIAITAGVDAYHVVLATAPRLPLSLTDGQYADPTYVIVGSASPRNLACLVTDQSPQDNFTVSMTAANYDDRFYANDLDHVHGSI